MAVRSVESAHHFEWIDVEDPAESELRAVAEKYALHPAFVADCLDPSHLPKISTTGNVNFVIIRVFDPAAAPRSTTAQQLTRKIAIFVRENLLLTIHRAPMPFLQSLPEVATPYLALLEICKHSALSFEAPLEACEASLEKLENSVLHPHGARNYLVRLHEARRKLANLKRLMWHTLTVVQRFPQGDADTTLRLQVVRETLESFQFFADELLEDATTLMHMELSLSAQKTNEVIRVLTVFSVFFLPLTFIVGVYGMNFHHMPEIEWRWGYLFSWGLMGVVTIGILIWFKRRGWLRL